MASQQEQVEAYRAVTEPVWTRKVASGAWGRPHEFGTMLFDLRADPAQESPVRDAAAEAMMTEHLVRLLRESEAPPEQFERLGLG